MTLFKLYVLLMLLCCFKYEYCHGDVIEFEQIQHYSTLNGISPFATRVAVSAVGLKGIFFFKRMQFNFLVVI